MNMFSATVTSGHSSISWWTNPMPSFCATAGDVISTGRPSNRISPLSGPDDPVDDVHQGGFAGSVLAGDGVDLASAQVETDSLQRMGRAERLADVPDREDRVGFHVHVDSQAPGPDCAARLCRRAVDDCGLSVVDRCVRGQR